MRDFPCSDDVLPLWDNLFRHRGGVGCIRFDNDESIWITGRKAEEIYRGLVGEACARVGVTTRRLENGVTAGSASHAGTLGAQRQCLARIPGLTEAQVTVGFSEGASARAHPGP